MKRFAALPALAMAIVPFLSAASTAPAHAATGDLSTVSITVSMDLPSSSHSTGPVVFQVTDVAVGAGPELTGADLVSNPSKWGGSVTVDVDNTTHHITVATESSNTFETATVTVTSPGLGAITLVSDDLWGVDTGGARRQSGLAPTTSSTTTSTTTPAAMPLTFGSTGGTATIGWTSTVPGTYWVLVPDGAAVFSFALAEPTTTTTAPATTTTTAPPAAAKAVQATPAFTG